MTVRVLYFASLKEAIGTGAEQRERPGGVRLAPVGGAVIDRELVVPEVLEVRGGELDLPGGRAEAGLPAYRTM